VNFRTSTGDIEAMPHLVARLGSLIHAELRSSSAITKFAYEQDQSGPAPGKTSR
jgi:hypothetical protein